MRVSWVEDLERAGMTGASACMRTPLFGLCLAGVSIWNDAADELRNDVLSSSSEPVSRGPTDVSHSRGLSARQGGWSDA